MRIGTWGGEKAAEAGNTKENDNEKGKGKKESVLYQTKNIDHEP